LKEGETMKATKDKNGSAYSLDMDNFTVIEHVGGTTHDCNHGGCRCESLMDLWTLIRHLWEMQGEYSADTMEALHTQMPTFAN
jgi:hypothetical protein